MLRGGGRGRGKGAGVQQEGKGWWPRGQRQGLTGSKGLFRFFIGFISSLGFMLSVYPY